MQLHGNAKLTIRQRSEIRRLHHEEKRSIRSLAQEFKVDKKTIQKWIHRESPLDQTMLPSQRRSIVSEEYREAIVGYRKEHPSHGPLRIAQALSSEYPYARQGHIHRVLLAENLIPKKLPKSGRDPL